MELAIGAMVKHPDHKQEVEIKALEGDMVCYLAYPPLGGVVRHWSHKATFAGKLW